MMRWFLLLLMSFSASVFALTPNNALIALLNKTHSYEASFQQTTQQQASQKVSHTKGRVYIRRPGRIRWVIESPSPQVIVLNHQTLWIYDELLSQATKERIDLHKTSNPAFFLSASPQSLVKQFTIKVTLHAASKTFHLIPKRSGGVFSWVDMVFNGDALSSIQLKNSLGQLVHFQFSHIKTNRSLPDHLFQFKPAKGVEILNNT